MKNASGVKEACELDRWRRGWVSILAARFRQESAGQQAVMLVDMRNVCNMNLPASVGGASTDWAPSSAYALSNGHADSLAHDWAANGFAFWNSTTNAMSVVASRNRGLHTIQYGSSTGQKRSGAIVPLCAPPRPAFLIRHGVRFLFTRCDVPGVLLHGRSRDGAKRSRATGEGVPCGRR